SHLELVLAFEHTRDPVAGLVAGKLDVALLTTCRVRAPLRELPLLSDEIVFVISPDHLLADRPALPANVLRTYPLFSLTHTPAPEVRWFVSSVFGQRPPRHEPLQFPLTEAIVDAARAGLGVAALSEWIAAPYLDHTVVAKRLKK